MGWPLRVVLPQAGAVVAAGAGLFLLIGLGQGLLSRAADVKDVMLTSCGGPWRRAHPAWYAGLAAGPKSPALDARKPGFRLVGDRQRKGR